MLSKFSKIALTIVAIIIIAIGYLYLAGKVKFNNEPVEVEESAKTTQESETTEADLSDWKTYKNEEYGFEFKYPGEYFILLPSYQTINETTSGFDPDPQEELLNKDLTVDNTNFDHTKAITVWVDRIDSLPVESTREKDDPFQDTTQKDLMAQRAEIENSKTSNSDFVAENKNSATKIIKIGNKKLKRSIWYSHQSGDFINDLEFFSKNGDLITIQSYIFGVKNIEEAKKDPQTNDFDAIVYSLKFALADLNNRKTYRNEKYGFEFKYPAKLSFSETNGSGKLKFWVGYEKIKNKLQPEGERAESVGVLVYDNIKNLDTEDFLTYLEENENWQKWSSRRQLNGLVAIKIEGRPSIGIETGTEYENTDIYLKNGNFIYRVYYDRINGLNSLEDVFNQILSTFKFTE